ALIWFSADGRRITSHLSVFNSGYLPRLRVVFGLVLAILAGLGLDALARGRADRDESDAGRSSVVASFVRRHLWAIAVWLVVVIVGTDVLFSAKNDAYDHQYARDFKDHMLVPLAIVAATLLLALMAYTRNAM